MRKCIRCDAEMIEDLDLKEPMHSSILRVTRPNTVGLMPKNNFGDVKAAVCPVCGYLETYLSRLDKIQKYLDTV
ncbi:MAG: nucleic acid-binding protein [Lawsonibacter sp.]|nr:nucleic acid-binding protein [Lawsonibacter sp.]